MKPTAILLGLILSCFLLLASCAPGGGVSSLTGTQSQSADGDEAYHKISAQEAKAMMDAGGVTVVDVRTQEEYAQEHIPGAVLVPNENIGSQPPRELPDKGAVLLVHCRTGVRSRQASQKLVELGYTQVYDFGGITQWPYETQSGEQ